MARFFIHFVERGGCEVMAAPLTVQSMEQAIEFVLHGKHDYSDWLVDSCVIYETTGTHEIPFSDFNARVLQKRLAAQKAARRAEYEKLKQEFESE